MSNASGPRETDPHHVTPPGDPRVTLAAERTLLAWIRTSVALMGLGFVVGRFGLFMRELAAVRGMAPDRHAHFSEWLGVSLILIGVLANVLAGIRHYRFVVGYSQGRLLPPRPVSLGIILAASLAAIGILIAAYLVWSSEHA